MKAVKYIVNTTAQYCDRCAAEDRNFLVFEEDGQEFRLCLACAGNGEEDLLPRGLPVVDLLAQELVELGCRRDSAVAMVIGSRISKGVYGLEDRHWLLGNIYAAETLEGVSGAERRELRALRQILEEW